MKNFAVRIFLTICCICALFAIFSVRAMAEDAVVNPYEIESDATVTFLEADDSELVLVNSATQQNEDAILAGDLDVLPNNNNMFDEIGINYILITSVTDVDILMENEPSDVSGKLFKKMDGTTFVMVYENEAKQVGLWPTPVFNVIQFTEAIDVFYDENGQKMVNVLKTPLSFVSVKVEDTVDFITSYSEANLFEYPLFIDGEEMTGGYIDYTGNPYLRISSACEGIEEADVLRDGVVALKDALKFVLDSDYECHIDENGIIVTRTTIAPESVYRMSIDGVVLSFEENPAPQNNHSMAYPLKEICDYCGIAFAQVNNFALSRDSTEGSGTGWLVITRGKTFFFRADSDEIIDGNGSIIHDNVNHGSQESSPVTGPMGLGFALGIWPASFDSNFWSTDDEGHVIFNFNSPLT